MRMAVFAAVVAAHIAVVWYFLTLWHVAQSEDAEQSSMTLVFLPPLELPPTAAAESAGAVPAGGQDAWRAPLIYRNASGVLKRATSAPGPAAQAEVPETKEPSEQTAIQAEPAQAGKVDWHAEAAIVAQTDTQHIVESEDRTARQAGALTAMIKPLKGPRKPAPAGPWDPNPRYRWRPAPGGGFVMSLNDHCEVFVLIMVWIGCTVGELPPARGDLFKNMHPPVKYGDWDWRLDDP